MGSPHDILTAYCEGRIPALEAIMRLGLSGMWELRMALADAGHDPPRCHECGKRKVRTEIMPAFETMIDGVSVTINNAVMRRICEDCKAETFHIPNAEQLTKVIAFARMPAIRLALVNGRYVERGDER